MDGRARDNEEFRRVFHGILPLYVPDLDEFDAEAAREQIEGIHYHYETHNAMFSEELPKMDYRDQLREVDVPGLSSPWAATTGLRPSRPARRYTTCSPTPAWRYSRTAAIRRTSTSRRRTSSASASSSTKSATDRRQPAGHSDHRLPARAAVLHSFLATAVDRTV